MKEHASAKSLALITQHLENKLAHYRMLTLFLKHFNLLQKVDRPFLAIEKNFLVAKSFSSLF